jgi:hypothetical protein
MLRRCIVARDDMRAPVFRGAIAKAGHFLQVHDALRELNADATIVAHITDPQPFQGNMMYLLDDWQPTMYGSVLRSLQQKLPNTVCEHFASAKIEVSFFDKVRLSVLLGRNGVTIDDVNAAPTEAQRMQLRPALGCDMDSYTEQFDHLLTYSAHYCDSWAQEEVSLEDCPPRIYWIACCTDQMRKNRQCQHHVWIAKAAIEHFQKNVGGRMANPALAGEDFNTLEVVKRFREAYRPAGRIRHVDEYNEHLDGSPFTSLANLARRCAAYVSPPKA